MKAIKLARGLPPLSIMQSLAPELMKGMQQGLERDSLAFLQYGHFAGYEPLRKYIAEMYGVETKRVFIGNGSMDTLNIFLTFLQSKQGLAHYACGKEVYDRPLVIAKSMGLELKGIDLTEAGLDPDALVEYVGAHNGNGVIYTIPWFDNPSGINHSAGNMEAVRRIADEKGWLVIRDGAYLALSYFETKSAPTVAENVIQTFSWSKTISAGCHTGGIIVPTELSDAFLAFISSWRLSPVMPTQMAAHEIIASGAWQQHMDEVLLPDGKKRVTHFNELMQKYLPESQKREILGGHFWGGKIEGITLDNWDEFVRIADTEGGVQIPHHSGFMPLSPPEESVGYIRIPIFIEDDDIADPLEQVLSAIANARNTVL